MVRITDYKLIAPISHSLDPHSGALPSPGQPACVQKPDTAEQLYALAESLLGFHLHPGQRQILDPALRRGLLNCSRQWGKSTVAALKAAFHAWTHPDHTVLIGSPSARQSEELLFKAHGFLRKLEPRASKSQAQVTLPNRSRILALPNAPDNVRGYSADLVILDEAARIADELYTALLPSISARPDAPLLLLSTPAGRRGYFYKAWHNIATPWTRIEGPAREVSHLNQAFIQEERATLSPVEFAQEYDCAFGQGETSVFSPSLLDATFDPTIPPLNLNIRTERYLYHYMGIDFGKRRDHSTIVILDCVDRISNRICPATRENIVRPVIRVRYLHQFPLGTPYTKVVQHLEKLMAPPLLRDRVIITADATGVGAGVTDFILQSSIDGALFVPAVITAADAYPAEFLSKEVGKRQLIYFLRYIIEHRYLAIDPRMTHARTLLDELSTFEEFQSPSGNQLFRASGSHHDDFVMALALAVWKAYRTYQREFRRFIRKDPLPYDEPWSGKAANAGDWPIAQKRQRPLPCQ
jgi:hypothetical protein